MISTIVNYVNFYYPKMTSSLKEDEIKTALVYRFLYEHYVKDYITLETILYKLPPFKEPPTSRILRNHLIFYRAFKYFKKHYKVGRGCVYVFDSPINSEVLGYLTGIIYWIFHSSMIASPPAQKNVSIC